MIVPRPDRSANERWFSKPLDSHRGSFKELRDQMHFVFATDIRQVLEAALEPAKRQQEAKPKETANGHERPKRRKTEKAAAASQA